MIGRNNYLSFLVICFNNYHPKVNLVIKRAEICVQLNNYFDMGWKRFIFLLRTISLIMNLEFLRNFGGLEKNNITKKLQNYEDKDEENSVIQDMKISFFYSCLMSLNFQSLNAKFNELILLIEEFRRNNFEFSAICLQETWLDGDADLSLFQIPGYTCLAKGTRCSPHGGLIIYLLNTYQYQICDLPIESESWEGLCIKIISNGKNDKNIYLCNLYRPPRNVLTIDYMANYNNELNTVFSNIDKSKSDVIIVGDFNIDLLKIPESNPIQEFFNNMSTFR
jgi:hypothetical protein